MNTEYVYGVVVYPGKSSKIMQNSISSKKKKSSLEKYLDRIIFMIFGF